MHAEPCDRELRSFAILQPLRFVSILYCVCFTGVAIVRDLGFTIDRFFPYGFPLVMSLAFCAIV
jgi:hypothetical protein